MFNLKRDAARRNATLSSLRRRNRTNIQVEALEDRNLLSTFAPAQIRHAYGFDSFMYFKNGQLIPADGRGQTIAIVDAYDDPKIFNDLAQFDSTYGIAAPPTFTKAFYTLQTNNGWAMEEALDVEWAHAMAPGANLLLVEAKSNGISDLMTAVNWARNQPGVSTVSMSWGAGEWDGQGGYDQYFTTPHGHQGVTFLAASGDSGAPTQYSLNYPASSPNVVSVGGTLLTLNAQGNYASEVGWSGSTGGYSRFEAEPGYQWGVQSSFRRSDPDVSYNAAYFWVYNTQGNSGWESVYGTSAGAPQWAALIAIADQGRALSGFNSLDGATQTLPALYNSPSDFHDITTGSNGAFSAHVGYDYVTGLGTPKAFWVVKTLLNVPNRSFVKQASTAVPSTNLGGGGAVHTMLGASGQDPGKPSASMSHPAFVTAGVSQVRLELSSANPRSGYDAPVTAPATTAMVVPNASTVSHGLVTSGTRSSEDDELPTQEVRVLGSDSILNPSVVRDSSAARVYAPPASLPPSVCDACFAEPAETVLPSRDGLGQPTYVDEDGAEPTDSMATLAAFAMAMGISMSGLVDKKMDEIAGTKAKAW